MLVDRDDIPGRVELLRLTRRVDRGRHQVRQRDGLVGFDESLDRCEEDSEGVARDLENDLLLAREVSVGRSGRDAGLRGDVRHRRLMKPVSREAALRGGNDLGTSRFPVSFREPRHGILLKLNCE